MAIVNLPTIAADPVSITSSVLNGKVDPLATDYNGNVQNVNIASGAGIVYSKLSLTDGILNADINSAAAIAASKLNLSTIAQALVMTSKIVNQAKGADVASVAGNIVLGDDGNYFDITGTNAITSITIKQAGTVVTLQFDSTASMVDGGNLKLQGNFAGAAEAQITLVSDGTNWFEVSRNIGTFTPTVSNALSKSVIQTLNTITGAVSSGIVTTPAADDTIPLVTEGIALMSLSATGSSTSNFWKITVVVNIANDTQVQNVVWLGYDGGNAIAVGILDLANVSNPGTCTFVHYMAVAHTTAKTFAVRAGSAGGTITFNGISGGRLYGGVFASSITIQEIKA